MVMIQLGREVDNLGDRRITVESSGFLRGAVIQNISRGNTAPKVAGRQSRKYGCWWLVDGGAGRSIQ